MTDLFISYAREDSAFVRSLYDVLEARDRRTWVDWDIPVISEWLPEIERAIDAADNALFVLSPDWLASSICRRELDHAVAAGKRLIPVLHRSVDADALPAALAVLNWIDFSSQGDFDDGFDVLIEALDTDLERKRAHSRLLQRARRWEDGGEDSSQTLRGAELADAEAWLGTDAQPPATPLHTRFITASRAVATRRQRITLAAVSLALVVTITLAVATWIQREIAVERRQVAEARRLAAESQLRRPETTADVEGKLLLAAESLKIRRTLEGFTAWAVAAAQLPGRPQVLPNEGELRRVAFSPDGRNVASATPKRLAVWNADTGKLTFQKDQGARGTLLFDPASRWVAAPLIGKLAVWDVSTGEQIAGLATRNYGGILALAVSPDGRRLAAGFHGKRLVVIDVERDTTAWEVETEGPVGAVAIDGESRWVAAAADTAVHVWSLDDGAPVAELPHERRVGEIAFDESGDWLASGGSCPSRGDCRAPVLVWEVAEQRQLTTQALASPVVDLRFRYGREELVALGESGLVAVWETSDWDRGIFVPPEDLRSSPVAIDDGGRHLVNGNALWSVTEKRQLARLPEGNYTDFDFAVDGSDRLAAAVLDGDVRIFAPPTGGAIRRFEHDERRSRQHVTAFDIDPTGTRLATIGSDNTTRLWDIETGTRLATVTHGNAPALVRFSPDGTRLAIAERCGYGAGCSDLKVALREGVTGDEITSLAHADPVTALAFSADGSRLATGTAEGDILLFAPPAVEPVRTHRLGGDGLASGREVRALAFTPDGGQLLAAEGCPAYRVCEAAIQVLDGDTLGQLDSLVHEDGVRAMALSPDGRSLASASSDLKLRLWDLQRGELRWPPHVFSDPINMLAISPDGRLLAAGGPSGAQNTTTGVLRIFATATGEERHTIPHERRVADLAISDDGRWVATATGEEVRNQGERGWRARVFDLASGEEASRLEQPDALTRVDFTPDGRWLVTAGWGQSAGLWPWRAEDLIASACSRLLRNFAVEEWQTYFPGEAYRCTCPGLPVMAHLPVRDDRRTLRMYREDSPAAQVWSNETPAPLPECGPQNSP